MDLRNYQSEVAHLSKGSCSNFAFALLRLQGEIGRLSWALSKAISEKSIFIHNNGIRALENSREHNLNLENALKNRIGSIVFSLATLCESLGWSLDDIVNINLDKKAND